MGGIISVVDSIGRTEDKLLEILIELQKGSEYNYISEESIREVSSLLDISMTKVYGIAHFYSMLSTEPRGKHVIQICNSSPCHVGGDENVVKIFEEILGIKMGEVTEDNIFSLEYTSCIGACDEAPAVRIDDSIYGNLTRGKVFNLLANLKGAE